MNGVAIALAFGQTTASTGAARHVHEACVAVDRRAGGEMGAAFDGRTNGVALFVALNVAHSCPYPGGRIPTICLRAV